ncbi:hypothetical protein B0A48_12454 [Cryoendolithus antarcticus]|uniref:Zn(2)-C6 fungal-type domain-containing protein n=1 Tax=Cryoendolithus antarcticus TaxID=1507870 RepID=A0A1V8SSJ5_9PEZI|nr:hypothetical protein B0A48_12454 [Cryoendolithus antarcticus]
MADAMPSDDFRAHGQLPTGSTSPNGNGPYPQQAWSGDEDDDDEGEDGEMEGGDRKRKRSRPDRPLSVSCEMCKSRKVKCDRGQPRCGWCTRNAQVCEYRERRKPGLRAGYGRELESRLDKLEGVLQTQQVVLQQLANHLGTTQSPAGQQSSPHSTSHHGSSADIGQYIPPAPYPVMASNVVNNNTYVPPTNDGQAQTASMSQPYAASQCPAIGTFRPDGPLLPSPLQRMNSNIQPDLEPNGAAASVSQDRDFPPYDLLYALTDLYFRHINTWCPLLHRRSTLDSLFGANARDEGDRILLHAIVATTIRFSTDSRLTAEARAKYYTTSKQTVLLYGLENSSVRSLQALVILALGSINGPPGWNLLALISRSAIQLGLATEITSTSVAPIYPSIYTLRAIILPEPKTFIEDEGRRRLFWMIYVLDRYATIATAFEFAVDDKEIDRKLPCKDELWARNQPIETRWFRPANRHFEYHADNPENLGAFAYYIEILGILTQIHRFLKKPVDIGALGDVEQWQQEYRQLDSRLSGWKYDLPSQYGNMLRLHIPGAAEHVNCIWIMMHITYHTTVIRLHSSAAYPSTKSPIFTPSFNASQRCRTAVEDICTINTHVRTHNLLSNLGPPFAFSLWVAARLLLVHGSTIDHLVNPAIHALVETLRDMGSYWEVADRYATLLSRVLAEYDDSERHSREPPSSVKILADMRRCAYDLDFLISRQPRVGGAITPRAGRTPAPNELEYLDVFDFFNVPRVPVQDVQQGAGGDGTGGEVYAGNTDITAFNFPSNYDMSADWFANGAV